MSRVQGRAARLLGAGAAAITLVATCVVTSATAAPATHHNLGKLSDYVKMVEAKGAHVLPNKYLVQVSGSAAIDGGSATAAASTQKSVQASASAQGLKVSVSHHYTQLWNGFSATLSDRDAVSMQQVPGVVAVFPVVAVQVPKEPVDKTLDASSEPMGGVSVAKSELGYTGAGIRVGVIDSGVDISHPDLGGTGNLATTAFPNAKIVAGWDFVGDAYNLQTNPTPTPDAVPQDDCNGHGTHVSGIIAGDGNPTAGGIQGVAPKAVLGEYRALGCNGSGATDIILQAMERAYQDKMDVVNMSLGDAFATWPDYPDAVAADRLVHHGVTFVIAAGNSGESGAMSGGSPGVAHDAITVASIDNNIITAAAFKVTPDGSLIGYANAEGSPTYGKDGDHGLVAAGARGTTAALGCDPIAPVTSGDYVLISRGSCTFYQKALNAQNAGAAGVVLYNNSPTPITPTVAGDVKITIPVVMISQADGQKLQNILAATSPITMSPTNQTVQTPNATGGLVSSFSSWGLAADLTMKPDLAAPGGSIWSDYPLSMGGHTSLSGTSMATPYVTGCVALLMQARPDLKKHPKAIKALLQNTANPDNALSYAPTSGLLDLVVRQGAGMIQIDRAILANQSVTPAHVNLGESQQGPKTVTFTVTNSARRAITYTVKNLDSVGYVGNSDPQLDTLAGTVAAPTTVTVPAHGKVTFSATITAPTDAPNGYVYGGWLQLTAGGATTLTIPYAGMAGDYQKVPIFDDSVDNNIYPALGAYDATKDDYLPVASGTAASFTMVGNDVPAVLFHLEYPVSDLRGYVYSVSGNTRQLVGTWFAQGEMGRDDSHLVATWQGQVIKGKGDKAHAVTVPAGKYILEIRGLEPMAKASKASNWVVYDTPAFTIAAPATAKTAGGADTGGLSVSTNG